MINRNCAISQLSKTLTGYSRGFFHQLVSALLDGEPSKMLMKGQVGPFFDPAEKALQHREYPPWTSTQENRSNSSDTKITTIDLGGGRQIKLIHMEGHASGLSRFLDKKGRRLYTGDAIFEPLTEGLGKGIDLGRISSPSMSHMECMDIRSCFKNLSARVHKVGGQAL